MPFIQPQDNGAREVKIVMTMDEWLFIVAGLKQLADICDDGIVIEDNLHCISKIEQQL